MVLSEKETEHIAGLARIGLNKEEIKKMSRELSGILEWVEMLKEADIQGVEPTGHSTGLKNKARPDRTKDFFEKAEIVKLFPESKNNYNKVKSVL